MNLKEKETCGKFTTNIIIDGEYVGDSAYRKEILMELFEGAIHSCDTLTLKLTGINSLEDITLRLPSTVIEKSYIKLEDRYVNDD